MNATKLPATLIAGLADYCAGIHLAQVPELVRQQSSLRSLDTLGCIVSGELADGWQPIVEVEKVRSGKVEATAVPHIAFY